jgi:dTDP-4-amino-4,6-dideoxygalactose transaminase
MSAQRINWWRTDLGDDEIAAISRAIRERHVNQGPVVRELEQRLAAVAGAPYAAVTTSGSVALLLSMMAAGVGPGDEVVVPACTFIAPAHAALLLGARVCLVDVLQTRPLIDPSAVAAAISPATKAVVVVHLGGRAADVAAVQAAVGPGVKVIEDCAQALCSRGPRGPLGTAGDYGAFSLGITKLITTGEGGFVAVRDRESHGRLQHLRNHGVADIALNRFEAIGCNFRMTDLQAAMGLAQLGKLERKIAGVRRVYAYYRERLAGLPYLRMLEVRESDGELPLWAEALTSEREQVIAALAAEGIEAKAFHPSLARSPHVSATGELPNAERFGRLGVTLPSGPDQPDDALARTVDVLSGLAKKITTPLPDQLG